jgi:hypothetical protein
LGQEGIQGERKKKREKGRGRALRAEEIVKWMMEESRGREWLWQVLESPGLARRAKKEVRFM